MRQTSLMLALALAGCTQASADPAARGEGQGLVVVELFQSQGCSSCPPANANLAAIAGRDDLVALNFPVTYWDHLGWKDTFARPEFTQRQRAYRASGHSDGVYTPQFVIDGRRALVGARRDQLEAAIRAAGPVQGGPALAVTGGMLRIGAGRGTAQVLLVTYDPRDREVPVRAGENAGHTLPHRNIVTGLRRIGEWSGQPLSIRLDPAPAGLRRAVLLQQGAGGTIIAAARA